VQNLNAVINDPDFKRLVMDDLEALGRSNKLSSLEKPKDILLTTEPFSIENKILTPTFKLKRNVGRDSYKK
jgi:long-chain acyl-CoA synthetase